MDQATKARQLEENVMWNVYNFPDNMQLNWLLTCMMSNADLKSPYYQRRSIKSEDCVERSHMDGCINVVVILT